MLISVLLFTPVERALALDPSCENPPQLKISITHSGVYRVPQQQLQDVLGCDSVDYDRLQLRNHGDRVGFVLVNEPTASDGDLVFAARHLPGAESYYNEFSPYNVYWLSLGALQAEPRTPSLLSERNKQVSAVRSLTRFEKDELRVRFSAHADLPQPEVWYWARLNSIDPEPFEFSLDLQGRLAGTAPTVRIGLRGWSMLHWRKYADVTDHRIEAFLNGHPVGSGEWLDQDEFILEIDNIPVDILKGGKSDRLTLRVPQRTLDTPPSPLIDAVLLNWIEVDYGHDGTLPTGQHALHIQHKDGGWFRLAGQGETPPLVISETGHQLESFKSAEEDGRDWHYFATLEDSASYFAVVGDAFLRPATIVADTPSNLRATTQQADYLILTHRRLRQAIEPLAGFHRQQGLSVQVIDIDDVYDEFSDGVVAPSAIRDFISHAFHNWQRPRPRFVLLVGDASWDVRSEIGNDRNYADWTFKQRERARFSKNSSHDYTDNRSTADRNLIPTWPVDTYEGYAASDNVFVAVDGDTYLPDLAIGRFPVSDPADVTAIVNKTIAYQQQTEVGPWRRQVLWITNEQAKLQRISNMLDSSLAATGLEGARVFPSSEEKDNSEHQEKLLNAFADGQVLVHFLGHGGRYVWRTGPPDIKKNHDLFTLDHLDQLAPTNRLPFVMSMTCYSAPFDHPTADSIGEKFLRMPDRGAIGILAASWRNSPGLTFSQAVLNELTGAETIGEAIMLAKQNHPNRIMIETYNLLGDPAVRLALPRYQIKLQTKDRRDFLRLRGKVIDSSFDGQVVVDWLDAEGNLVQSEQLELRRGKFEMHIDRDLARDIARVTAYAWNPQQGIDAMGGITLGSQE